MEAAVLLRIDHIGIACRNLDEAIARYESAFGLTVMSREENLEQGVRFDRLVHHRSHP